ncbi:RuvB-like domain-containing protein [Xanthovirga aplysinae]|uniref:RuvB-like domain-containing protein n=1 Tax=Xanthovirga aplysinae TaxID=2529853 RepID=UPI0012BB9344|nr:RuvB-like domain-containing protein [Xanthovirga aplysinae]MTI29295.1 hypothetical protein [Xanthovirga aplysinae]
MARKKRKRKTQSRKKNQSKKNTFEPLPGWAKLFVIGFSLVMIFGSIYLAIKDNTVYESDLTTIEVTLKEDPIYDQYKIKSTTYKEITLKTKEYQRDFKVTGKTYKSTDHYKLRTSVKAGDHVQLKVKKGTVPKLNKKSFVNNYNEVFGLSKKGISLIDLVLKAELEDKDSKWAYCFTILGLVMLPYGFIKKKPMLSMEKAISLTALVGLLVIIIIAKMK